MDRQRLLLLSAAAALFLTNIDRPSLPSLDDCFYARKGVEMSRSGSFFSVTWNGSPTFQNPSLQIWILGRAFSLLGETDAAARLPSALAALGILLMTYRAAEVVFGRREASTAIALILATPIFSNQARRCMMEIPATFWVSAALVAFARGLERAPSAVWFLVSLGGAILTKSVLGLMPLVIVGVTAVLHPPSRRWLRSGRAWAAILGGLLVGASWPLHQALLLGPHVLREHYVGEVASRSIEALSATKLLTGYPKILFESFQPLALPALLGVITIVREWWRDRGNQAILFAVWAVVPLVVYSFSSVQSPRYIFPILPALGVAAAVWLVRTLPRIADVVTGRLVPAVLVLAALIFWAKPELLRRPGNDAIKSAALTLRAALPAEESVSYLGSRYWSLANPLMYYAERLLEASAAAPDEAVRSALAKRSRVLALDRERLAEVRRPYSIISAGEGFVFVRLESDR